MLIKCPECELQVSDKAINCPHCGYPITSSTPIRKTSKKKHPKLPNGFGQISELSDSRLKNKFRVMITVGRDTVTMRYKTKILGYYPTYNKAYTALAEYNKNPYDLDNDITVAELYEKWTAQYFEELKSSSSERTIKAAWNYCSSIYNMKARNVRARHIKGCMTDGIYEYRGQIRHTSPETQSRIKSMFNLMFDYALEYEIVDRNYARTFNIPDNVQKAKTKQTSGHIPFTQEEIDKLWDNLYKVPYVDIVLIQCYSGWRPQELGLIKLENVDLENGYMIGGMKTEAGENRTVPIHSKIKELVVARYNQAKDMGSEYLLNCTDTVTHRYSWKLTYDKYRHRFDKIRDQLELNPDHRAHDPRKHFVTMAKKAEVDQYAIKYIVGHKIDDITERVYTQRDPEWLRSEIEKIK